MPDPVVNEWNARGTFARIRGVRLKPRTHRGGFVLSSRKAQGEAYFLEDDGCSRWILKKFSPGKVPATAYIREVGRLIPRRAGFESGCDRVVLTGRDLADEPGHHHAPELAAWLEDTILMPHVSAMAWMERLERMAEGGEAIPVEKACRIAIAVVDAIDALEQAGAAHRDLSGANVMVDGDDGCHLIDWDTLYHASLPYQPNTCLGSPGYMAPWTRLDARATWRPDGDRFALGVLVCEALAAAPGVTFYGDGTFLCQDQGPQPTAESVQALRAGLQGRAPDVLGLFERLVSARRFEECPAPAEWRAALLAVQRPPVSLDRVGEGEPVCWGGWVLLRRGQRLWLGHREDALRLEVHLAGLGAFSVESDGRRRTVFSDGKVGRLCSFRVDGAQALGQARLRPLDEKAADLEHYHFAFHGGRMRIVSRVSDQWIEIEKDRARCRLVERGGRHRELREVVSSC